MGLRHQTLETKRPTPAVATSSVTITKVGQNLKSQCLLHLLTLVIWGPSDPRLPPCRPTHQRLQLLGVDEAELRDKVVEVLVAGVDVRLGAHLCDAVKVVDVDVHEHTEQAGQDLPHHLQEVLGERRACTREGSPEAQRG